MSRSRPFTRVLQRLFGQRRPPLAPGIGRVTPRHQGRFGWWGPIPYYSRHTGRGSQMSVSGCGCCLPFPLLGLLAIVAGLRTLLRRR